MSQFAFPHSAHRQAGIPISGETWQDQTYSDQDLAGVVFHECGFVNLRLARMDFSKCIFNSCRFDNCTFSDCTLLQIQMAKCTGTEIVISGGVLEDVTFSEITLQLLTVRQSSSRLTIAESEVDVLIFQDGGLEQHQMTLSGCMFSRLEAIGGHWLDCMAVKLDLSNCVFGKAQFERTGFIQINAADLDLSELKFISCNLYQSNLSRARFRHAESSIFAECQLTDADLKRGLLNGCLFSRIKAEGARFDGASLNSAMFPEAILSGASFAGATALNSVFNEADLTDTNFAQTDATGGVFRYARLNGANVDGASFVNAQLHGAEGNLDSADTTGAQGTIEWRAEREREALDSMKTG